MSDVPRDRLLQLADAAIRRNGGPRSASVYIKFTCEACGERCTLAEANTLREKGECWVCGHVTVIDKGGFMLVLTVEPPP